MTNPNLQPFAKGDPRAVEAGRKGAEVKRQKREALKIVRVADARAGAAILATLTEGYQRDQLGASAAGAAQHVIARIANGEIPIKDASDAAALLKVLHDMTRLEEGQSTSNIMHGTIDAGAILQRIEALRGEISTTPPALPTTGPNPSP